MTMAARNARTRKQVRASGGGRGRLIGPGDGVRDPVLPGHDARVLGAGPWQFGARLPAAVRCRPLSDSGRHHRERGPDDGRRREGDGLTNDGEENEPREPPHHSAAQPEMPGDLWRNLMATMRVVQVPRPKGPFQIVERPIPE